MRRNCDLCKHRRELQVSMSKRICPKWIKLWRYVIICCKSATILYTLGLVNDGILNARPFVKLFTQWPFRGKASIFMCTNCYDRHGHPRYGRLEYGEGWEKGKTKFGRKRSEKKFRQERAQGNSNRKDFDALQCPIAHLVTFITAHP